MYPEIFWIKSILNSGDIAIDVGANYGLYTYNLSKAVGDNGFVYAFEPTPYTFSCLTRIIKLFRLSITILSSSKLWTILLTVL